MLQNYTQVIVTTRKTIKQYRKLVLYTISTEHTCKLKKHRSWFMTSISGHSFLQLQTNQ